jgi:putative ABC transport system permease protein
MLQDLRYAIRTFRKAPGFTIVALLTLALGIGATSAIFTVVNSVLLRPLPFHDPARLYAVSSQPFTSMDDADFAEYQGHSRTLEDIAGFTGSTVTMLGAGEPASVLARHVTASFWSTLGVQPVFGRVFRTDENDAIVLSHALWQKRFQLARNALGKAVTLDGKSYTIVGVMPPEFNYPASSELWTPLQLNLNQHGSISLRAVARLKPGVNAAQVNDELSAMRKHFTWGPPKFRDRGVRLTSLQESVIEKVGKSLWVLLGAVGLLLLIACVNVANLLIVRGARRAQEFVTRAALGASRLRLIRQSLVESVVLSIAGGALGLLLALWGQSALAAAGGVYKLPRLPEVHIDSWVLGFTVAIAVLTGLLFGLAPALQVSKTGLQGGGTRVAGARVRGALVIAEIAVAMVLLVGAGLLIRSFMRLRAVPTGFESQNVLAMTVNLPDDVYSEPAKIRTFHSELLSRIASLPSVAAAGAVNWLPFGALQISGTFHTAENPKESPLDVTKPGVSNDYFRAMGIRLLAGRVFNDRDTANSEGVAIVGETTARRVWPGENPIGKRITLEDNPKPKDWLTVVGVVDDVKQTTLAKEAPPAIYQPLSQVQRTFFLGAMSYVVRTTGDPRLVARLLREQLRAADPNLPIFSMSTMDDLLSNSTAEPRFQSRMLGAFAGAALLLAMIGIYGVMAFSVAARTREIGVRMALGAAPRDVMNLVLGKSSLLIATGLVLGLGGALAATRVLRDFLFEVTPTDPVTLIAGSALLAAVAFFAAYLPARSAMRVDPMVALRHE